MKKLKQIEEVEAQNYVSSKKHKQKTYTYFFLSVIMLVLIVGCSLVEISMSNNLATQGLALANIQDQIDTVRKENMIIAEQVYADSSYTHIASQAATLGFIEAKTPPLFINTQAPIAMKP